MAFYLPSCIFFIEILIKTNHEETYEVATALEINNSKILGEIPTKQNN